MQLRNENLSKGTLPLLMVKILKRHTAPVNGEDPQKAHCPC